MISTSMDHICQVCGGVIPLFRRGESPVCSITCSGAGEGRQEKFRHCEYCSALFSHRSPNMRLCPACRKLHSPKTAAPRQNRGCHDCGEPISDYRCPACWKQLRLREGCLEESKAD